MKRLLPLLALLVLTGCLRRYPAPTEPVEVTDPYGSIAAWRGIELPQGEGGEALPDKALRLAVGPEPDSVYADDALFGREGAKTADGWEAALELLGADGRPVVLLTPSVPASADDPLCGRLGPVLGRTLLALRPEATEGEPEPRAVRGIALGPICAAEPIEQRPTR